MKKITLVFFAFILVISVNCQEKRLALVIGNGNYERGTLANPENDAMSMEESLREIGFEVLKYENLGQKDMARAIDDFGNKLADYDVGLFFYAGHGIQSKGYNYLLPVDANLVTESDVEFNCVRADRVLGKMEDAKNNVNIVILDACRDNPFERSWTRKAKGRGLATMSAPMGSIIAFATSPGNTASDGEGDNGLYTSGLLKYMNEPGITAIQMLQKVTAHVIKGSGGDQLPWVTTSLTADFFLVHGSAGPGSELENYSVDELHSIIDSHNQRTDGEISLAILPFTNLTGDRAQDYIVKGQNDALYTQLCQLGQVKPIRVVGGRTAAAIGNREMSIPDLARKFDVDFLVEGSVMLMGDSIILQIRLIEAYPEEKPVFARPYTSSLRDILKLHSNIAGHIAQKIDLELSPEELIVLPESRSVNPEAYKEYLRGMFQLSLLTPESIENGLKHLHKAVKIDPGESFAYAGLALGYLDIAHGPVDPGGSLEKAEAAASQAEKIDPNLPEVYAALAQLYYYKTWEYVKAEENFIKALKLNPNLAITHYHYSWLLYSLGRMEEAIVEHKLAQKYDPFRAGNTAWLGGLYLYDGRYEDAIKECQAAIELNKGFFPSYYILGDCYLGLGMKEEALETHKKLYKDFSLWAWPLCRTYVSLGMDEEAEMLLEEYEKNEVIPFVALNLCVMNAALGNLDEAFKWLNYKPNHVWVAASLRMPEFEVLRKDPRFADFKKQFTLPEE